jgi:hypothetical protein
MSIEAPLIPVAILDVCSQSSATGGADFESVLIRSMTCVLSALQQQCMFHREFSSVYQSVVYLPAKIKFLDCATSSLVCVSLLKLLREFLWYG